MMMNLYTKWILVHWTLTDIWLKMYICSWLLSNKTNKDHSHSIHYKLGP